MRAVLVIAAIASTATHSAGAGQQAPFRSRIDLVAVDVSVRNPGQPLLGLQAADFELLDNGVPQEIVEVAYGSLPIDITLAIDLGFTSSPFADSLRTAVKDQVPRFEKDDRLRLIVFNSRVPRATDFTRDVAVLDRVLREAKAGGQSPVSDVVADALASATPADRRHLVIFVTDGAFNSSAKPEMLLDLARRSRATMSLILPIPIPKGRGEVVQLTPSPTQRERSDALHKLAMETGGGVAWISPGGNAGRPLAALIEDFRASYVLYFAPRGVEPTGLHTLQVNVKRPGVRVKARRAYVR